MKAWKAFEEVHKSEIEKSRKWFASAFARVTDAGNKEVEESSRGLDEPTTIDVGEDGPPASWINPLISHSDFVMALFTVTYYLWIC